MCLWVFRCTIFPLIQVLWQSTHATVGVMYVLVDTRVMTLEKQSIWITFRLIGVVLETLLMSILLMSVWVIGVAYCVFRLDLYGLGTLNSIELL